MPSLLRKKLLLSMPSVPPEGLSQNSTKSLVSGKNLFLNLKKKNFRSSAGSGKLRLKLWTLKQQQQKRQTSRACKSLIDRVSLEVKMIVRFRRVHHFYFSIFKWQELLKQQLRLTSLPILIAKIVSTIAAVAQSAIGVLLEAYLALAAWWEWLCQLLSLSSLSLSRYASTWSVFSLLLSMVLLPRLPWSEHAENTRFDFNREIPKLGIQGKFNTVWWPMRKGGLLIESIAWVCGSHSKAFKELTEKQLLSKPSRVYCTLCPYHIWTQGVDKSPSCFRWCVLENFFSAVFMNRQNKGLKDV